MQGYQIRKRLLDMKLGETVLLGKIDAYRMQHEACQLREYGAKIWVRVLKRKSHSNSYRVMRTNGWFREISSREYRKAG